MSEVVGDFFYKKKDLIGHGAFAVVFKGRHRKEENFVVAVKVITKKNLSKTQNLLSKEIRILKELHHENVVSLFDCKETPNSVHLVMEYCNGGDLADYLQAKGTLSEDTIHIFLRQIASAMCTLQSKGIVHRDLKPQNLLLSHSGQANPVPSEIKIKIADFGFARFLPGEMMAATLCGSPMYMAPEVIMSKVYDAKADLWSVGTIVYQCLTGKAPFQASTPQALKKFYEKSKVVSPVIPAGTSDCLKDLLLGLLKRSPKDRIDFASFFGHPFLTGTPSRANSTPMAVPGQKGRKYSGSPHRAGSRSPSTSPNFGVEALGDVRVDVLRRMTPPYDVTGTSPQDPPTFIQVSGHSPSIPGFQGYYQRQSPGSPQTVHDDEAEDFVIVPPSPEVPDGPQPRHPSDPLFPCYGRSPPRSTDQRSGSPSSPCRSPGSFPQRRATFIVGSPSSCSSSSPPRTPQSHGSPATPPKLSSDQLHTVAASPRSQPSLPVPVPRKMSPNASPSCAVSRPERKTSTGRCPSPKGETSPRKRAATVSGAVPKSQPTKPVSRTVNTAGAPLTSVAKAISTALHDSPPPLLTKTAEQTRTRPVGTIQRAMSNIEPLTAQDTSPILTALARQTHTGFGIQFGNMQDGSENKQIMRVHSSPAILAVGLQRNKSFLGNKGFQFTAATTPGLTSPIFRRHSSSSYQALRQHAAGESPPVSASPPLPTIPGSPTKLSHHKEHDAEMKPLKGLFTFGSSTPPSTLLGDELIQFGSLPSNRPKADGGDRPAVINQGNKITRGFTESPGPVSRDQLSVSPGEAEPCSPDMEGPIALIAPELPEDTLMETEHTEGVRKLNFASSLVDAILEVISARGTPLATLADSMAVNLNESFLADQIGFVSEECRRTEQLVLYVKTLRVLNLALLFAQQEIKAGHLKPSNAVKNVINDLNERYHRCLENASQLKKHVHPKLSTNRQSVTVSADKLMYGYAMELCQNAALDELFGNPRECKRKYETAQFLLQGLEEDAHKDSDRSLLRKYKIAVDQRLHCLTKTRLRKLSQTSSAR